MAISFAQAGNFAIATTAGDASVTGTSFSAASATLATGNAGDTVTIAGAGVAGADLVTTIATVLTLTTATLSAAASSSVSGKLWSLGAGANTSGSTASSATFKMTISGAVTAGDLGHLSIVVDSGVTISSVTDNSGSNTWQSCGTAATNTTVGYTQQVFRVLSLAAAAAGALTITIVCSGTPAYMSAAFTEFTSSATGTWSQDQFKSGNVTSSASAAVQPSAAITTTAANEVLVLSTGVENHITALTSGYTGLPTNNQNPQGPGSVHNDMFGDTVEYEIVTSIQTSITPSLTQSAVGPYVCTLVTFAFTAAKQQTDIIRFDTNA